MRALLWITLVLAALWAGWWATASRLALKGAETAFAAAPAAGWQASHAGIAIAGFPSRFDLTLTEPSLARGGYGWRAPFLQVLALAYRPHHVILAFPAAQTLTLPGDEIAVASESMQASVVIDPVSQTLDRVALVGEAVAAGGARAGTLRLGLRRTAGGPARYEAGAAVLDFALPPALRPTGLPVTGATAIVDGFVTFAAPLDRAALASPPAVTRIEIARAEIVWGAFTASASGVLSPDAQGAAAGAVTVTLSDPAVAGALLAAAGVLPEGARPPGTLDLTFGDGRIRLGPFDIGPAPRLSP